MPDVMRIIQTQTDRNDHLDVGFLNALVGNDELRFGPNDGLQFGPTAYSILNREAIDLADGITFGYGRSSPRQADSFKLSDGASWQHFAHDLYTPNWCFKSKYIVFLHAQLARVQTWTHWGLLDAPNGEIRLHLDGVRTASLQTRARAYRLFIGRDEQGSAKALVLDTLDRDLGGQPWREIIVNKLARFNSQDPAIVASTLEEARIGSEGRQVQASLLERSQEEFLYIPRHARALIKAGFPLEVRNVPTIQGKITLRAKRGYRAN